jgi:small GTP-binding protein
VTKPDAPHESPPEFLVHAREALARTLEQLALKPEERAVLSKLTTDLEALAAKLDRRTFEIAAFGFVGRGKSSLLNALAGAEVFPTGVTHGTTTERGEHPWKSVALDQAESFEGLELVLVDTPGLDEIGGEARERLAREVAGRADLVLLVVSGDLVRKEKEALHTLQSLGKPILLVVNQSDRYSPEDLKTILHSITTKLPKLAENVVAVAAAPPAAPVRTKHADGRVETNWERPAPAIDPLRKRILEILEAEGQQLLALNTLLAAGELHEQLVDHRMTSRDDEANTLIWRFAVAKGLAVALNPVPVADLAGGVAVDVAMIVSLSKHYELPITRASAATLVRDVTLATGALGALHLAGRFAWSGLKSILAGTTVATGGLSAPLTLLGYTTVGVAQAGTAAFSGYIVGRASKLYLRQGCHWGPKGIKTVVREIVSEARENSILDRLRDDLSNRLAGKKDATVPSDVSS